MTILLCATESHLGWLNLLHLPILCHQWLPKQQVAKFMEINPMAMEGKTLRKGCF